MIKTRRHDILRRVLWSERILPEVFHGTLLACGQKVVSIQDAAI